MPSPKAYGTYRWIDVLTAALEREADDNITAVTAGEP